MTELNLGEVKEKGPKEGEIQEELLEVGSNITTLEDLLQGLENKLAPILSHSKPAEQNTKGKAEIETEVGKTLREVNARISMLISQVDDLNGRVEV